LRTVNNVRRRVLLGLGVLVCVYAVVVVLYARYTTDIGLGCTFGTEIQKLDSDYAPPETEGADQPQLGDHLVQVGPKAIATWSDFLHALADLDQPDLFPRLRVGPDTAFESLEQLEQKSSHVIQRGSQEFVRVVLEHNEASGVRRFACWRVIGPPPWQETAHSLLWFSVKIVLLLVVSVVFWKRPNDEPTKRFFILCIVTVGAFMGGYHWRRIATCPPLIVAFMVCAVLLPAVSLHFYLVFPRAKQFMQRRPRLTMAAIYGVSGSVLAAMLGVYLSVMLTYRHGLEPTLINELSRWLVLIIYVAFGLAALQFALCVVVLSHSFVATVPASQERNQVKWILVGALLATVPVCYTLYMAITQAQRVALGDAAWPMFFASLCFTIAYGISISRYGLMEVDKVLNWGLVSLGVSAAAGLVYTGLVFLGTFVIGSRLEPHSAWWQAVWVSLTAWLLLLVLDLVRWRLRQVMDRRLHREKYQLDKTLRRMSQAVEQLVDPPTLCRRFLQALADLLVFRQGFLYLRDGEPPVYRLAACIGPEPTVKELPPGAPLVDALANTPFVQLDLSSFRADRTEQRQLALLEGEVAIALRHEGTLMAVLLVGARITAGYDAEELHLLMTFAQIAALALHSAKGHQRIDGLNRDLHAKVEKIAELQRRVTTLQGQLLRKGSEARTQETGIGQHDNLGETADPGTLSPGMVGSGPTMQRLLHMVHKVAVSPSAVLIRGESGTGKELLARALHDTSSRKQGPFVKVHCAALSPGLLESELFGHVKGAFTGAHKDKVGRFEMANGGTLFLDEIGDISLETQTKLLRVLQEMTFERVGSSEPITVDVRLIAATHQNLEDLIKVGRFREDLLYRLNVITIRTPALRERREDIYELALHFLKLFADRSRKELTGIDDEALELLKLYHWPGNIRELENTIERAVVLADGTSITAHELPEELLRAAEASLPDGGRSNAVVRHTNGESPLPEPVWTAQQERQECERLVQALAAAGGNKSKAARALGMPRSTLMSKLEKFGLIPGRR
jgi:transcriptional regulator with GAF, ATPase, and Fis domain